MRRLLCFVTLVASALMVSAQSAHAISIVVSKPNVRPGDTITVSGDVLYKGSPVCSVNDSDALVYSTAFRGLPEYVPGTGYVFLRVDGTGHFHGTITIPARATNGVNVVYLRCGGPTGGQTTLAVTGGLPVTGGGIGDVGDGVLALGAVTLIGGGVALLVASRRRVRGAIAHP